jgi:hypothetical protein
MTGSGPYTPLGDEYSGAATSIGAPRHHGTDEGGDRFAPPPGSAAAHAAIKEEQEQRRSEFDPHWLKPARFPAAVWWSPFSLFS